MTNKFFLDRTWSQLTKGQLINCICNTYMYEIHVLCMGPNRCRSASCEGRPFILPKYTDNDLIFTK